MRYALAQACIRNLFCMRSGRLDILTLTSSPSGGVFKQHSNLLPRAQIYPPISLGGERCLGDSHVPLASAVRDPKSLLKYRGSFAAQTRSSSTRQCAQASCTHIVGRGSSHVFGHRSQSSKKNCGRALEAGPSRVWGTEIAVVTSMVWSRAITMTGMNVENASQGVHKCRQNRGLEFEYVNSECKC
jgi:hypothetical protein